MSFGILSPFQSVPVEILHPQAQEYIDVDVAMSPSNTSPQWDSLDSELIMYDTTAEPDPAGHEVDMSAPYTEELEMQEPASDDPASTAAAEQAALVDAFYDEVLPGQAEAEETGLHNDATVQDLTVASFYNEEPPTQIEGAEQVILPDTLPEPLVQNEDPEASSAPEQPTPFPEQHPPDPDPPEDNRAPAGSPRADPIDDSTREDAPEVDVQQPITSTAPVDNAASPSVYSDVPPVGDPHRLSLDEADETGLFIDPPPPVLLTIPADPSLGVFSLFNSPDTEAPSTDSKLLLSDRPTLYYEPLSSLFEAFRQESSFDGLFDQYELFITLPDLDLSISEDNVNARNFTLHDLGVLHYWKLNGPLRIELDASHLRFFSRYEALKAEIEQTQGTAPEEFPEATNQGNEQEVPTRAASAPAGDSSQINARSLVESGQVSVAEPPPDTDATADHEGEVPVAKDEPDHSLEEPQNHEAAAEPAPSSDQQDYAADDYANEYAEDDGSWQQEAEEKDPVPQLPVPDLGHDGEINYDEEDPNEDGDPTEPRLADDPTPQQQPVGDATQTSHLDDTAEDPEEDPSLHESAGSDGDADDNNGDATESPRHVENDPINHGPERHEDNLDEQPSSQTVSSSSSPVVGRLTFLPSEDYTYNPTLSSGAGEQDRRASEPLESEVIAYEDSLEDETTHSPATAPEGAISPRKPAGNSVSVVSSKRSFSDFERDSVDDESLTPSKIQGESKRLKVS